MVTISRGHFLQALIDTFVIFAAGRKSEAYKVDELVKSRHSGENRSPGALQLIENTGFWLTTE
jgi:hypothetical protein